MLCGQISWLAAIEMFQYMYADGDINKELRDLRHPYCDVIYHLGIADPIRPSTILDFIRFKMVRRPPHQFTSAQSTYVGEGFHHHKNFCVSPVAVALSVPCTGSDTHFAACLR